MRRERSSRCALLLLLSLFLLTLFSQGLAQTRTRTFPLEALQPGQRGYGLSAGAGNLIERFDVEVLALQYDVGTGFPLVLIRASGPLIESAGGVASGMSGSPVYLPQDGEDTLLGAVGYTFPNSTGGLGLVTPIATMREVDPASPVATFGPNLAGFIPVQTPLLLSGLSQSASQLLRPLFSDEVSLLPLQSSGQGGGKTWDDRAYSLEPGSAISVQLVRGDITIAAVGTLTLLEDGKFWAFGHPLLGSGDVSFALAPAYITALVPSRTVPFKLADSGSRLLGSVTQDRPYAISGRLNQKPDFMPVTLTLNGDAGATTKRFEVTRDERFYAPLVAAATLQSLGELVQETGAGSADLAWEISLRNGQTVNLLDQISDPKNIALAAARLAGAPLDELSRNPFQKADMTRLELNLTYHREERIGNIVEVVPERQQLKPGDALRLNVRLQPFRQGPVVESLSVPLPRGVRGPLRVSVRGGLTPPEPRAGNRAPPLYSFAELLTALEQNVQASDLVVEAVIDGHTRLLKRLSLPYTVRGLETLTVTVGKRQMRATPASPPAQRPQTPLNPERDPLDSQPPLEPSTGRPRPGTVQK